MPNNYATQLTAAGILLKSKQLGPSYRSQSAMSDSGTGPEDNIGTGPEDNIGTGPEDNIGTGPEDNIGTGPEDNIGTGACACGRPVTLVLQGTCKGTPRNGPGFPFRIDDQEESNWCWAAVASGVDRYFNSKVFSSQCEIASDVEETDACAFPDEHNQPASLDVALIDISRLAGNLGDRPKFEDLQAELDANRPVCLFIAWNGGGGHFAAVCGYAVWSSGLKTIDIADPFYPDSTVDFDGFPDTYHGGGKWGATYFTM